MTNKALKISLVTTSYNRATTIASAIESVLAQTYPHIEYIIIDGASTDGTMDVVNQYADRITTIVSEPDKGMYEAINKGIAKATGDYIGLLHSDDILYDTHTIEDIVNHLEATGAPDFMYANGLFTQLEDTSVVIRDWQGGTYSKKKVRYGWLPLHTTCYIKKSLYDTLGTYDESFRIAADTDLLVRFLYKNSPSVSYLDRYVVKMRMGGLSTDPKTMKKKMSEDIRLYRAHGLPPYFTLGLKMASKVPQFVRAKLMKK